MIKEKFISFNIFYLKYLLLDNENSMLIFETFHCPNIEKIEITIDFNGPKAQSFNYSKMEWYIIFKLYLVISTIISVSLHYNLFQ